MTLSARAKKLVSALSKEPKLGDIKKLGKEIKRDHTLALELWKQGDLNSRLLASLIFDKKQISMDDIADFASDMLSLSEEKRNQLSDWLLANQLTKDKKLVTLMESWQENPSPVLRRWFWYHQARLRWMGRTPPPTNSAELLKAIENGIAKEVPEVQWAMNFCACQIGVFEKKLRPKCIKLGMKLGLYKDDVVAKNCTPSYLPEFIRIEVAKRKK